MTSSNLGLAECREIDDFALPSKRMVKDILVLEDEEAIRRILNRLLSKNGYRCSLAAGSKEALNLMENQEFDLILCDVNLNGESGLDFIKQVLAGNSDTAVVMVTAVDDPEIAEAALQIGAYGYILKPFKHNELMINIANALRRRELEIGNRHYRDNLKRLVSEQTEKLQITLNDLRKTLEGTIHAMAMAVESRDPYTAGHQRRVAWIAEAIGAEMGLSNDQLNGIRMAGLIHDLGKISVPAEILSKPGRLNDMEFGIIKCHPQVGYDILKEVQFPWPIAKIVFQHHERMDGSGYPWGLEGEKILLEARILAVADVVEAMASHRPYRPALGQDRALEEISKNKRVLYDRDIVDACLKVFTEKDFNFLS